MSANPLDFSGKTALVTGGSRGIGATIARALATAGARVAINYVADSAGANLADAKKVAADCKNSLTLAADVGDDKQVAAMFDRIKSDFGGLDLLINNAGILRDRTIKKLATADWDAVLKVNLSGAFHCIQHATALLKQDGRIVNMSSVSGNLGLFGQANYAASKAGLIALTKVAARELAKQRITVNAIAPGFVDTDMTKTMPPDVTAEFLKQIPLGRMAQPTDIANAVLFLCSPLAAYITGQVLHVNGGFYMG